MPGDRSKMRCVVDGDEFRPFDDVKDALHMLGLDDERHDIRPQLRTSPTRTVLVKDKRGTLHTIAWIN